MKKELLWKPNHWTSTFNKLRWFKYFHQFGLLLHLSSWSPILFINSSFIVSFKNHDYLNLFHQTNPISYFSKNWISLSFFNQFFHCFTKKILMILFIFITIILIQKSINELQSSLHKINDTW